jgi:hypothetical protein
LPISPASNNVFPFSPHPITAKPAPNTPQTPLAVMPTCPQRNHPETLYLSPLQSFCPHLPTYPHLLSPQTLPPQTPKWGPIKDYSRLMPSQPSTPGNHPLKMPEMGTDKGLQGFSPKQPHKCPKTVKMGMPRALQRLRQTRQTSPRESPQPPNSRLPQPRPYEIAVMGMDKGFQSISKLMLDSYSTHRVRWGHTERGNDRCH